MFVDECNYKNTVALFVRIELTEYLYLNVALFRTIDLLLLFPFDVSDSMWNSIVSVPDHCLLIRETANNNNIK